MSRPSMEKKLRIMKRAWKKFTNKLQSKLHNLHIPESIVTATRRLRSVFQRSIRIRLRSSKSSFPSCYQYKENDIQYDNNFHHLRYQYSCSAIHIDELFDDNSASTSTKRRCEDATKSEERKGKEVMKEEKKSNNNNIESIEDAWNVVVASSPHLRPVDERAEEFIRKFRREIVLQKEKSLLEFAASS